MSGCPLISCKSAALVYCAMKKDCFSACVNLFVTYANVSSASNSAASERPLWFHMTLNVSPLLGRWHTQVSSEWRSPGNLLSFCRNTLMMTQLLQASVIPVAVYSKRKETRGTWIHDVSEIVKMELLLYIWSCVVFPYHICATQQFFVSQSG